MTADLWATRKVDPLFPVNVAAESQRLAVEDPEPDTAPPIRLRTTAQKAAQYARVDAEEAERIEALRLRRLEEIRNDPERLAQAIELGVVPEGIDIYPPWISPKDRLAPIEIEGIRLVRVSTVAAEPVEWSWQGRIALGKVHLIDGDPGLGKSTMTLDYGARVSAGQKNPDGSPGVGPAGVVILTAEDGIADTVRPRLEAAGADLNRVAVLTIADDAGERPASIPDDLSRVEQAVVAMGAKLVIIDPLMAHLGAVVNSHRDQDIRRALAPLHGLAERTGAAILVVRHLNKATGGNPLYRGGGSIGIVGAARIALLVAPDPDDETGRRRILAVEKCNLAPIAPAIAFTIESAEAGIVATSMIRWGEVTGHTATQLLAALPEADPERPAQEDATEVLLQLLADGPVTAKDARRLARDAGVADRTLDRAKESLGVKAVRVGGLGADGHWEWRLPPKDATEAYLRQPPEGDALREDVAHLADAPPRSCPSCGHGHRAGMSCLNCPDCGPREVMT